jgi:Family of unknown function (DUF6535)
LPPISSLTADPSPSDKRVNVLWFLSLVLSLSAALLATLVQRWARSHMQIFLRYKHPLKLSRIRQYLHEGVERWHMAAVAEAVPALIHIALFLFMCGLADFLYHADVTVGAPTVVCIVLYFMFYAVTTIVPVWKPQFPLRSPFSVMLWFLAQGVPLRLYRDRVDGTMKPVSQNMSDGQMELALESKHIRRYRDRRAIAWLVGGLTEDVEMESFAQSIPGSFNPEWGVRVWGRRANDSDDNANEFSPGLTIDNYDTLHPPSRLGTWNLLESMDIPYGDNPPTATPSTPMRSSTISRPAPLQVKSFQELCTRIGRLFQTCTNPYLFHDEDKRLTRSRTCVQAVALLIFRMKADLNWFGDIETIGKLLKDQGYGDHPRPSLATGSSQTFAANWTGLSIVIIQNKLVMERLKVAAKAVLLSFEPNSQNAAISRARRIDNTLKVVWDRVEVLDSRRHGDRPETDEDRRHRVWIDHEVDQMADISVPISGLRAEVETATYEISKELPWNALKSITRSLDICDFLLNPIEAQLKYLRSRFDLSSLSSRGPGAEQSTRHAVEQSRPVTRLYRPTERQLWRLLDIHEGSAVGFTLELYLISLREILSTSASLSDDPHDTFFSALEAITSNRALSECTISTQQLILELILDIAANRGVFYDFSYPNFIEEELVRILRNVVAGVHDVFDIGLAMEELEQVRSRHRHAGFRENVLNVLRNHLPIPSAPPMAPAISNSTVTTVTIAGGPVVRASTAIRTIPRRPPQIQLRITR